MAASGNKGVKTWVMRKTEALVRKYHKRNFYYRIMVPFAIFSTALICITTVGSWFWMNGRMERKQRDTSVQILQQVQQYTDDVLYSDSLLFLNRVFFGGASSYLDDFFVYGSNLPSGYAMKAYQELATLCLQQEYLENVTLYNASEDMLLDNTYGLCYNASKSISQIEKFLPISDYLSALTHADDDLIYLSGDSISSGVRGDFTAVKLIPLHTEAANAQGFVAFHYNEAKLLHSLYQRFGISGEMLILSSEQEVLAKTEGFSVDFDSVREKVLNKEDHIYFSEGGVRYCMLRTQSAQNGWIYLLCLPVRDLNAQSYMFRPVLLGIAIFAILVSNVIVHWISKKVYQPIHVLSDKFKQQSKLPFSGEEFSVIEEAFNFLESQMDVVQKVVGDNRNVLLQRTVMKLLSDESVSDEEILKSLSLCGTDFEGEGFCVAVTAFDRAVFQSLTLEEREYFTEKAQDLLKDWFGAAGIAEVSAVYPDRQVVSILNLSKEQYDAFCGKAPELTSEFRNRLHIQTNHAISGYAGSLYEVRSLYLDCLHYLRYDFIYGFGNVFISEFINGLEQTNFSMSAQAKERFHTLLQEHKGEEAEGLLTEYVSEIRSGRASLARANVFVTEVYRMVVGECTEAGVFKDPAYKEQIEKTIGEAITLADSMECIDLMIQRYCSESSPKVRTESIRLIDEISEYIRLHCCENITLPVVAEAFHVTPSHLSRLFKSVRGENFSSYVLDQKLTLAAQLLLQSPDMSIMQISESLGYYTPTYFTRLFKEKFGVTPSQYRRDVMDRTENKGGSI